MHQNIRRANFKSLLGRGLFDRRTPDLHCVQFGVPDSWEPNRSIPFPSRRHHDTAYVLQMFPLRCNFTYPSLLSPTQSIAAHGTLLIRPTAQAMADWGQHTRFRGTHTVLHSYIFLVRSLAAVLIYIVAALRLCLTRPVNFRAVVISMQ